MANFAPLLYATIKRYTHIRERNRERLERIADVATRWIGSTASLVVHTPAVYHSFCTTGVAYCEL
ncbi:hypothetical protein [Niabella hibiscisoli]|uniref:hypothetical protein n=1 Tax=Niabella hibiscisoli TaxID=1825928 RepID=UPI001F0DC820|nr:hypothetical protein [Niabella hibiscisoli]MCH5718819.1 hypothetical protein [Niabella hibiscisoli]